VSGIDAAAAEPDPPRQKSTAAAAVALENFEGDVAVIMDCSASKPDKIFLIRAGSYTCER
jgi:hypothetical protein